MSNWSIESGSATVRLCDRLQFTNPGNVNHTMTSWQEIVSSCPISAVALRIFMQATSYAPTILQIGIGGAGSEVPIITLPWITASNWDVVSPAGVAYMYAPVNVPQGVRLSTRFQYDTAGQGVGDRWLSIYAYGASGRRPTGYAAMETVGLSFASTSGTALNTTSGENTFGAWVEVLTSSPRPIRGLVPQISARYAAMNQLGVVEVGIGPAGSEQGIARVEGRSMYGDWPPAMNTDITPTSVPAGTRVALRALKRLQYGQGDNMNGYALVLY